MSERELPPSKLLKKTPSAVDLDNACVKGGFYSAAVDSLGRISDLGDHIRGGKTNNSSRFSKMISVGLRLRGNTTHALGGA